ncbi:MAG: sialate O-acetylesterase [Bdellovibrionota bacterium]
MIGILLFALSAHADSSLILSPRNLEVVQRDRARQGNTVHVTLKPAFPEASKISITVHTPHKDITRTFTVNSNGETLNLDSGFVPQGGWYSLQVRQSKTRGNESVTSNLDQFAVGDVFVIAGQSNAASWAEEKTATRSAQASMWNPDSGAWLPLADPMPFTDGGGGSYWPLFADLLYAHEGVPLGFVNTAIGGTGIGQWQKGGASDSGVPLYAHLLTAVSGLNAQRGYRMILWHQGESDSYYPAPYRDQFLHLVQTLDEDTHAASRWMVSVATYNPDDLYAPQCGPGTVSEELQKIQRALPNGKNIFPGPTSDDLIGSRYRYAGNWGLCVHFSKEAQAEMSRRWLASLLAL